MAFTNCNSCHDDAHQSHLGTNCKSCHVEQSFTSLAGIKRFDHKNLNLDTEEFKNMNPTAENIVVVIYNLLRDQIDKELDLKVILYETERNFVEYPA